MVLAVDGVPVLAPDIHAQGSMFMKKTIVAILVVLMVALVAMPGFAQAKPRILFMPGVADPFYTRWRRASGPPPPRRAST